MLLVLLWRLLRRSWSRLVEEEIAPLHLDNFLYTSRHHNIHCTMCKYKLTSWRECLSPERCYAAGPVGAAGIPEQERTEAVAE